MAYSKIKKTLFVLLCCFILIFPFWCVRGLCAESETITPTMARNLYMNPNRNYFTSSTSANVYYLELEKGYIYTFYNNLEDYDLFCAFSNDIPDVNVTYFNGFSISRQSSYSLIANSSEYLYFDCQATNSFTITREKIPGMDSAVGDLVDNVGINSIWNIFDISINYIVIVVVFALGCFIIFKLIRRISKGKEGL